MKMKIFHKVSNLYGSEDRKWPQGAEANFEWMPCRSCSDGIKTKHFKDSSKGGAKFQVWVIHGLVWCGHYIFVPKMCTRWLDVCVQHSLKWHLYNRLRTVWECVGICGGLDKSVFCWLASMCCWQFHNRQCSLNGILSRQSAEVWQ